MKNTSTVKRAWSPASWILFSAILAASLIYSVGLDGPLVFDDTFNLNPVRLWAKGRLPWQEVMFGNASGVLGRPVSMASFMLSAAAGRATALDFKLGNLITHLLCGLLIYLLLRRLISRGMQDNRTATIGAAVLTSLWLLHPLHVSTVLYAVQRMAQLSALFVLAAILVYIRGRDALDAGQRSIALAYLFGGFPLLWALGLLSKENAALAPTLCLLIELAYYRPASTSRKTLGAFYTLTLVIPLLAAVSILTLKPDKLLAGYAIRDFGMFERLLSQLRALCSYIGMLLAPRGSEMGVFTDDFTVSTGLLTPPSTLIALLALSSVSIIAIRWRRTNPHFFAGWFFFLIAHGVESTILPLELYYEHRNYLPSVGLLLAIGGLALALPSRRNAYGKAFIAISVAAAIALGNVTWQQSKIWRTKDALVDQAIRHHPNSVRAAQAKFVATINRRDYAQAMRLLSRMAASREPRTRLLAHLDMVSTACLQGHGLQPRWLDLAVADARDRLTVGEIQSVVLLMQSSKKGRCAPMDERRIAETFEAIADAAIAQADDEPVKWQLRYAAAVVYSRTDLWREALPQARLATRRKAPTEVRSLLIKALALSDRQEEAIDELRTLRRNLDRRKPREQEDYDAAYAVVSARFPHADLQAGDGR